MTHKEQGVVSAASGDTPGHIAIVMDGNGRWAERQGKSRHAGHKAGVDALRSCVEECGLLGVQVLTVFAFSSENWRRPKTEVSLLMELFFTALQKEFKRLNKHNVRLRFLGDLSVFSHKLQKRMAESEAGLAGNSGLVLQVAVNYGGRWDITQAARKLAEQVQQGSLEAADIDEAKMSAAMSSPDLPDPDLFIRTGGEQRISNFLLWQSAYAELYFTDTLWPDFGPQALRDAIADFAGRQRRFGQTGAQISASVADGESS